MRLRKEPYIFLYLQIGVQILGSLLESSFLVEIFILRQAQAAHAHTDTVSTSRESLS